MGGWGWGWVDNESSPHRIMDVLCKTLPTKHQSKRSGQAPISANDISHPIFGFLSSYLKEVRTTWDATSDTGTPSVRSSIRHSFLPMASWSVPWNVYDDGSLVISKL